MCFFSSSVILKSTGTKLGLGRSEFTYFYEQYTGFFDETGKLLINLVSIYLLGFYESVTRIYVLGPTQGLKLFK